MEKTTSTKAIAGSIVGYVVTIMLWLLTLIPGWELIPEAPKVAIVGLLSAAIGYGFVYFAPANQRVSYDGE